MKKRIYTPYDKAYYLKNKKRINKKASYLLRLGRLANKKGLTVEELSK
jgi:hypothetical protein